MMRFTDVPFVAYLHMRGYPVVASYSEDGRVVVFECDIDPDTAAALFRKFTAGRLRVEPLRYSTVLRELLRSVRHTLARK
jgi:hypothetical protein